MNSIHNTHVMCKPKIKNKSILHLYVFVIHKIGGHFSKRCDKCFLEQLLTEIAITRLQNHNSLINVPLLLYAIYPNHISKKIV